MKLRRIEEDKKFLAALNTSKRKSMPKTSAETVSQMQKELEKVRQQQEIYAAIIGKQKLVDNGTEDVVLMKKKLIQYQKEERKQFPEQ